MGSCNRDAVKVVVIETQYVKTDTTSFKSVVQSLTGKDACVSWSEKSSFDFGCGNGGSGDSKHKRKRGVAALDINVSTVDYSIDNCVEDCSDLTSVSKLLSNKLSFKDLDIMLLEMPPLDDLQCWLWNE